MAEIVETKAELERLKMLKPPSEEERVALETRKGELRKRIRNLGKARSQWRLYWEKKQGASSSQQAGHAAERGENDDAPPQVNPPTEQTEDTAAEWLRILRRESTQKGNKQYDELKAAELLAAEEELRSLEAARPTSDTERAALEAAKGNLKKHIRKLKTNARDRKRQRVDPFGTDEQEQRRLALKSATRQKYREKQAGSSSRPRDGQRAQADLKAAQEELASIQALSPTAERANRARYLSERIADLQHRIEIAHELEKIRGNLYKAHQKQKGLLEKPESEERTQGLAALARELAQLEQLRGQLKDEALAIRAREILRVGSEPPGQGDEQDDLDDSHLADLNAEIESGQFNLHEALEAEMTEADQAASAVEAVLALPPSPPRNTRAAESLRHLQEEMADERARFETYAVALDHERAYLLDVLQGPDVRSERRARLEARLREVLQLQESNRVERRARLEASLRDAQRQLVSLDGDIEAAVVLHIAILEVELDKVR
jgi:hypothetical protein